MTVEATAMLIVEEPEPGAAMVAGLKLTVTPLGWPLAAREMAALKPPETVVEMVELPLLPTVTESAEGEAPRVKAGVDAAPVNALISPRLGLPQPVTRSYPVTAE